MLVLRVGLGDQHQRIGAVVHMQEFAARRARAPNDHFLVATQLGLVCLANLRGNDVAS